LSRYICGENDVSFENVIAFHEGLPVVRFVLVGVNEQAQVGGRSLMLSIPETERVCSQLLKELSGSLCSQVEGNKSNAFLKNEIQNSCNWKERACVCVVDVGTEQLLC
jgi:hypothetical protein